MNKDFYNELPGMVCFILDELIEKYENEEWFENAWNEYREHILKSNMNDMKMPGAIFNKYEIHNLLKIENDNTTFFTNKELKMIDDYIKELEAYKYNLDRDYLRLEKENQELKKELEEKNKSQIFIDTQDIEERYAEGLYQDYLEEENKKYKNQQKEFIDYINSYIKLLSDDPDYIEKRQKDILEEILSKYKEMVSNNVESER